jgi:hypothetical protein
VNQANIEELKKALFLAGAHGMKICFNLPWAWSQTLEWDIPEGQQLLEIIYLEGGAAIALVVFQDGMKIGCGFLQAGMGLI